MRCRQVAPRVIRDIAISMAFSELCMRTDSREIYGLEAKNRNLLGSLHTVSVIQKPTNASCPIAPRWLYTSSKAAPWALAALRALDATSFAADNALIMEPCTALLSRFPLAVASYERGAQMPKTIAAATPRTMQIQLMVNRIGLSFKSFRERLDEAIVTALDSCLVFSSFLLD
jgi:hypothetical protein